VTCGNSRTFNEGDPLDTLSTAPGSRSHEYITLSGDRDIVQHLEELERWKELLEDPQPIIFNTTFTYEELQNNMENPTLVRKLLNCDFSFTEEFLLKLKILHHQSPVSGVEQSISTELEKYANNDASITLQIKGYFKRWFDKTETAEWLTESSCVWKKAIPERVAQIEGSTLSVAAWPAESHRKGTQFECHRCGQPGHKYAHCPQLRQIKCYRCGQPGHKYAHCPQLRQIKCYMCGQSGHKYAHCPQLRQIKCYMCGQPGHKYAHCPQLRQIKCYMCGQPGHKRADCPQGMNKGGPKY
jgi:hypothetical protein